MTRLTIVCLVSTFAAGCVTITTTPRLSAGAPSAVALQGHLDFDGGREHLPAPLAALPPAAPDSATVLRYRYEVRTDDTDLSILMLLNPLTLVGCPTGSVTVTADATLDVLSNGDRIKHYTARSVARRLRTIYSGDPLSKLRGDALRATADNIGGQLAVDAQTLTKLMEATPGDSPANDGGDR